MIYFLQLLFLKKDKIFGSHYVFKFGLISPLFCYLLWRMFSLITFFDFEIVEIDNSMSNW